MTKTVVSGNLTHWSCQSGIDTADSLLVEMRKEAEREAENQTFMLEPLLALTGSLTLTQTDAVSALNTFEIPRQLFLTSKLGMPEAILWLNGLNKNESKFRDGKKTYGNGDQKGLRSNTVRGLNDNGMHEAEPVEENRKAARGVWRAVLIKEYLLYLRKELVWGWAYIKIDSDFCGVGRVMS